MALRLTRLTRLARQPLLLSQHSSTLPIILPYLRNQQLIRCASNNPNLFQSTPSPLRLPPDEQAEFERLQRTANTQEGFNPTSTPDFTTPASLNTSTTTAASNSPMVEGSATETPALNDELGSVPLRKGAPPEFEGDVNPKTGEVGGPKNEPLRWGASGDYSFNGRVTDF
ncbi:DUF1674-domain-containing protein [Annulohypoxylon bovei var. microspora]|nr:DUF1674-domain-containing protein [Annulohypoxylon bovei var. microspora]